MLDRRLPPATEVDPVPVVVRVTQVARAAERTQLDLLAALLAPPPPAVGR